MKCLNLIDMGFHVKPGACQTLPDPLPSPLSSPLLVAYAMYIQLHSSLAKALSALSVTRDGPARLRGNSKNNNQTIILRILISLAQINQKTIKI